MLCVFRASSCRGGCSSVIGPCEVCKIPLGMSCVALICFRKGIPNSNEQGKYLITAQGIVSSFPVYIVISSPTQRSIVAIFPEAPHIADAGWIRGQNFKYGSKASSTRLIWDPLSIKAANDEPCERNSRYCNAAIVVATGGWSWGVVGLKYVTVRVSGRV